MHPHVQEKHQVRQVAAECAVPLHATTTATCKTNKNTPTHALRTTHLVVVAAAAAVGATFVHIAAARTGVAVVV
jgi:hypothetical protein